MKTAPVITTDLYVHDIFMKLLLDLASGYRNTFLSPFTFSEASLSRSWSETLCSSAHRTLLSSEQYFFIVSNSRLSRSVSF